MALTKRTEWRALDRFIEEVREAWGDGKDPALPFRVRTLMERFIAASADEPWVAQLIREALPGRELYRDPDHGFILMGHIHKGAHQTSPHDHGPCWVLYGVALGEIEITTYSRTDNGRVPGRATLEEKDRARLTPGVVKAYLPKDIHATRAIDPTASLVFRFLSADLNQVERYRYDLETGSVSRHQGS